MFHLPARELVVPPFDMVAPPWEKSSKCCCEKLYLVFTRMDNNCIRNARQWLKRLARKNGDGRLCKKCSQLAQATCSSCSCCDEDRWARGAFWHSLRSDLFMLFFSVGAKWFEQSVLSCSVSGQIWFPVVRCYTVQGGPIKTGPF